MGPRVAVAYAVVVLGGDGHDLLDGGLGIDEIAGGPGNDLIFGGEDDDELQGNEGDDWLEGGPGGDILVGDVGAPTGQVPLYAGNDVLIGGPLGDKMTGFSGDDIMLGEGGFDKFNGLLGFDWASFENETHGVSVDMTKREFIPNQLAPAGDAAETVAAVGGTAASPFEAVLHEAVQRVENYRAEAEGAVGRFLRGEDQEVHKVALAVQESEISMELFLQAKNKVVQAYQEIMRMQL